MALTAPAAAPTDPAVLDEPRCMACDFTAGRRSVPGGRVHTTEHWVVEHCFGPLGLGTLIAKPLRHVLHVAELAGEESAELGPLLQLLCAAVTDVTQADQVYVCLWSHPQGQPAHLHFVIQPVTRDTVEQWQASGPTLQTTMFAQAAMPTEEAAAKVAEQLRQAVAARAGT